MLVFPPFYVHPPARGLPPMARESYSPLSSAGPAFVVAFFLGLFAVVVCFYVIVVIVFY
jgi:hypothetical protein